MTRTSSARPEQVEDEILSVVRISTSKARSELVETKIFQHIQGKSTTGNFVFDLFRRAEDVRVILSETAHAQQAVHHT